MSLQLKDALDQAGLLQTLTSEPTTHQFYLTLTRFELPIFIKVRATKRQDGLRYISSRSLNSLIEHDDLTKEEAKDQVDEKCNKWFLESTQEGMLVYWSFLK